MTTTTTKNPTFRLQWARTSSPDTWNPVFEQFASAGAAHDYGDDVRRMGYLTRVVEA